MKVKTKKKGKRVARNAGKLNPLARRTGKRQRGRPRKDVAVKDREAFFADPSVKRLLADTHAA